MNKKLPAFFLILFLSLLTGSSSDMPLVLCLGENGHVGIEPATHANSGHPSIPMPMGETDNSPCHDFDSHEDREACGSCYDFLLTTGNYTINPQKKKIVTCYAPLPITPVVNDFQPLIIPKERACFKVQTNQLIKTTILLI